MLNGSSIYFTKAIISSFRLDGIEEAANRVETENLLPWRAGGFQFHRYKILMDIFLPSQNLLEVDDMMLMSEKCLLHRMMSSSVRQWERGDEAIACPLSSNQRQNMATGSPGRSVICNTYLSSDNQLMFMNNSVSSKLIYYLLVS